MADEQGGLARGEGACLVKAQLALKSANGVAGSWTVISVHSTGIIAQRVESPLAQGKPYHLADTVRANAGDAAQARSVQRALALNCMGLQTALGHQ